MLDGLLARLRSAWQRARAAAGDDLLGQMSELRELALDEKQQLEQDAQRLAQRVRRNTERGRHAFTGERP